MTSGILRFGMHTVDFAIITAKTEEFEAVLKRFPTSLDVPAASLHREYMFRQAPIATGGHYSVAIVRGVFQGLSEAQNVASDLIEDLHPAWILVVGIAGSVPSDDLFLGDIVLATYVHEFSLGADTPDGREHAISGYPPPKSVCTIVAGLAGKKSELGDWNSNSAIGVSRPGTPEVGQGNWTGDPTWDSKISKAIEHHRTRTAPKFLDGPIASSDDLLKDYKKMQERLAIDRRILAVDMETAGIAKACSRHDNNVPFLAIRAVSDIVGLKRSPSWTEYACAVAASFASVFISLNLLHKIEKSGGISSSAPIAIRDVLSIIEIAINPVPLGVLATAFDVSADKLHAELSDVFARQVLKEAEDGLVRGDKFENYSSGNVDDRGTLYGRVLVSLLSFIDSHSREDKGIKQSRNAFILMQQLDDHQKRLLAPRLFDVLDRPMKALGDKKLVEDVATLCIRVTCHSERAREEAECDARARICGLSWVYQRTSRLGLAADEGNRSLNLSESLQFSKNIAFCQKCLGRLNRMQAEESTVSEDRQRLLGKSIELLNTAIQSFSGLEEYGNDHSEVGDCYSLLGRTFLIAGDLKRAERNAEEAKWRITDTTSKDFLDLQILLGDIAERHGKHGAAIDFYTVVAERRKDSDFQQSEIVARAMIQRAKVFARLGNDRAAQDYQAATSIWEHHGEHDLAATAEWEAIQLSEKFPAPVKKLLQAEKPRVRVAAYRLWEKKGG